MKHMVMHCIPCWTYLVTQIMVVKMIGWMSTQVNMNGFIPVSITTGVSS